MQVSVSAFLTNGMTVEPTTIESASVEEAQGLCQAVLSDPNATMNWAANDGMVYVLASRQVVGFLVSAA